MTNLQPRDIPWKESNFHWNNDKNKKSQARVAKEPLSEEDQQHLQSNTKKDDIQDDNDDDDEEENEDMFAMFADPDPLEIFRFEFSPTLKIELSGHKQENGQLLHSTGLTLWRASDLLCQYLLKNVDLVCQKWVLELGAGLGLCGILAHKLDAKYVYITDGDVETLENLRQNVFARNHCDPSTVSCPQLIWGESEQYPTTAAFTGTEKVVVDTIIAADVIYVTEVLEPLWNTVDSILSLSGQFVLGYARRNVSVDLVLELASKKGFDWVCPPEAEGVFVFRRK